MTYADAVTPSSNTRSYTLQSVPSPRRRAGRSFLFRSCLLLTLVDWLKGHKSLGLLSLVFFNTGSE